MRIVWTLFALVLFYFFVAFLRDDLRFLEAQNRLPGGQLPIDAPFHHQHDSKTPLLSANKLKKQLSSSSDCIRRASNTCSECLRMSTSASSCVWCKHVGCISSKLCKEDDVVNECEDVEKPATIEEAEEKEEKGAAAAATATATAVITTTPKVFRRLSAFPFFWANLTRLSAEALLNEKCRSSYDGVLFCWLLRPSTSPDSFDKVVLSKRMYNSAKKRFEIVHWLLQNVTAVNIAEKAKAYSQKGTAIERFAPTTTTTTTLPTTTATTATTATSTISKATKSITATTETDATTTTTTTTTTTSSLTTTTTTPTTTATTTTTSTTSTLPILLTTLHSSLRCELCERRGFGIPSSYRWCWCCFKNCGGFRESCVREERFCQPVNGTCLGLGRSISMTNESFCERFRRQGDEGTDAAAMVPMHLVVDDVSGSRQRRQQQSAASFIPSLLELYEQRPAIPMQQNPSLCHDSSMHGREDVRTPPCLPEPAAARAEEAASAHRATIDALPRSTAPLSEHLVISHCHENVNWIVEQNLEKIPATIYRKCDLFVPCSAAMASRLRQYVLDGGPDSDGVRRYPSLVTTVASINNCGFEVYGYLAFIVDFYQSLPDVVYFVQGAPMRHAPYLGKIIANLRKRQIDYIPLSNLYVGTNGTCSPTMKCFDHLQRLSSDVLGFELPNVLGFYCCACFAVSKRAILARPLAFWQQLLSMVDGSRPPMSGASDSIRRTESFVFEAAWGMFFGESPLGRPFLPLLASWHFLGLHGFNVHLSERELENDIE